jgi:hypothetical protein
MKCLKPALLAAIGAVAVFAMLAPATLASAGTVARSAPASTGAVVDWQNQFNQLCLDGREGTGNVTLQLCGTDGTHEVWTARTVGSPSVAELKDVFNGLCLDGREGTGNVTLQPCGFPGPVPDGTHEYWTPLD